MKISIDTKEDSHDDIRKVIKMLQHLVGETSLSSGTSLIDNPTPESASLFNMFQESSTPAPLTEEEKKEAIQNMDDNPEIIPY